MVNGIKGVYYAEKQEETEGLSLLGNKKTVYKDTYAPEVLETFCKQAPRQRLYGNV